MTRTQVKAIEEMFEPRYDTEPPTFDEAFQDLKTEQSRHGREALEALRNWHNNN